MVVLFNMLSCVVLIRCAAGRAATAWQLTEGCQPLMVQDAAQQLLLDASSDEAVRRLQR